MLLLGPDDDDRRALHLMLDRAGKEVAAMDEVAAATRYLEAAGCDAVIADAELAPKVIGANGAHVIAVVRTRDLARAMDLFGAGVDDVVIEPLDELAITLALRHIATLPPKPEATAPASKTALVGDGPAMTELRELIERIAAHRTTVMITGESGTGKELVARAIHDASPRSNQRFVAINCAAIPAGLLESELFGHVRGAFTDAIGNKAGLFEEANGGTLFLDEVGEMPLPLQAKLLRVLQEGTIRRVGDNTEISVDVRLIAATLRDLKADVAAGAFREDLFYRLDVVPVSIPPLRGRREDIPQLARFFLDRHGQRHQKQVALADDAIAALCTQSWPGNVRELENILERALVLADGPTIDLAFLETVMTLRPDAPTSEPSPEELSIKKATRALEADLIRKALVVTQGNRTNAAKLLEISHRALLYKMKEYGIS